MSKNAEHARKHCSTPKQDKVLASEKVTQRETLRLLAEQKSNEDVQDCDT